MRSTALGRITDVRHSDGNFEHRRYAASGGLSEASNESGRPMPDTRHPCH